MDDYDYIIEQCKCGNEVWKDIPTYEGHYQASNMGRIKSLDRYTIDKNGNKHTTIGGIMKPVPDKQTGHLRVGIWKNSQRRTLYVHRLIMETFVGECPNGMEVCHNDGNSSNNHLDNLRYDTRHENLIDASKLNKTPNQKLSPDDVLEIRKRLLNGEKQADIAKDYGVGQYAISAINRRATFDWLN
jgi:hypothetical protein